MENNGDYYEISEFQTYLYGTGSNYKSYNFLGCHKIEKDGKVQYRFCVWAPNAAAVGIGCDNNNWSGEEMWLNRIGTTGIWCGIFSTVVSGDLYKYVIKTYNGEIYLRADPYARLCELRPKTASVVYDGDSFKWTDKRWMDRREKNDYRNLPVNIYECHVGSWRVHKDGSFYNYRELADELIPYILELEYTHIEFMPLMEYPFDGSWGYQVTGYFAATSRYGTPSDLKYLINKCHQAGIGVIMDWVPAHFPRDEHGLRLFDGNPCYEYGDSREGEHKDWGTMVFDYSKGEVVSFLMSSAYFWAEEYHIDGLRVDAVSSMLYRDYSRRDGEWIPNVYGGNGNLEAVELLKKINNVMETEKPGFMMIAEESTAWPYITASCDDGGLGFTFKWNMGWMNDALTYMSMDPYFRSGNHNLLTFLMFYAFSEKYILPLSHDEVVHGKGSLINKMYGSYDEKFDSYRSFLTYYMTTPGKKIIFMGGEFGQFLEWRFDDELEWNVMELDKHKMLVEFVKTLNAFYKHNQEFYVYDNSWDGFQWINEKDYNSSVISYIRYGKKRSEMSVVVVNFTPVDRYRYKIGVPYEGEYEVAIHTNSVKFGGDRKNKKMVYKTREEKFGDMKYTLNLTVDGNSAMIIKQKQ